MTTMFISWSVKRVDNLNACPYFNTSKRV